MNTAHLDRNDTKDMHPTVDGAHVYMVQQITKARELVTQRHAVLTYEDNGYISVTGERKTKHLGIASYYITPDKLPDLNALIDEMTAWIEGRAVTKEAA